MSTLALEKSYIKQITAIIKKHADHFPVSRYTNKTYTNGKLDQTRTRKWWHIVFKDNQSATLCLTEIADLLQNNYPDYFMHVTNYNPPPRWFKPPMNLKDIKIKHISKKRKS